MICVNQPETSIANQQEIRNYFAKPTPKDWDETFATQLITLTASGFARLKLSRTWIDALELCRDAKWTNYVTASAAVDKAYHQQNLLAVAQACRAWWHAAQALQHAEAERPVSA